LEGVSSDVAIPDRYAYLKMGERDIDNAMPWDKIDPAEYNFWTKQANFDSAIERSKNRVLANSTYKLINENAAWIDQRNNENTYSLQLDKFKKEQEALEEKAKKYKSISDYDSQLKFNSLPYEQELMNTDISLKEKRDRWHEALEKDIYVEEALNVLGDLLPKSMQKSASTSVTKSKSPKS
jgi:carboxyl-terminal processing protease